MKTFMEMTNVPHKLTEREREKIRRMQRSCVLAGSKDPQGQGGQHVLDPEPPRQFPVKRSLVVFCRKCGASHTIHPYSDQNTL